MAGKHIKARELCVEEIEAIRRALAYCPDTGRLIRANGCWRKGLIGMPAGGLHRGSGYMTVSVDGRSYMAHRVVWILVHGSVPVDAEIDHIDGVKSNNRIENLRLVDSATNLQNQRVPYKNNKTGFLGVSKTRTGRFHASIQIGGKQLHLGLYATPEEAHTAYISAKRKLHTGGTL